MVRALEPNRSSILVVGRDPEPPGAVAWTWGLYPLDGERTPPIGRLRWQAGNSVSVSLLDP